MALPKLEGRLTLAAQSFTLTDRSNPSGTTITVAASDYFLTSSTSLLSTLGSAMTVGTVTYVCTVDDTADSATGLVSLAAAAGTFSLTWGTATALRDALGFGANVTNASTATGGSQTTMMWLSNVGRSNPLGPDPTSTSYQMGAEEADFAMSVAPSGATKQTSYTRRYIEAFEWQYVLGSKMWKAHESYTNSSLQTFWENFICAGLPVRYHPDRSSDTVFWTWVMEQGGEFKPSPVQPGWTGASSLWNLKLTARKYVT